MTLKTNGHKPTPDLHRLVAARFEKSTVMPEQFFAKEADTIAMACWEMAKRFQRNGRLIAFGNGAWASDAQHVAVEFVHPVIVGKRALPALALTNDSSLLTGMNGNGLNFAHQLRLLARPQDISMGFFDSRPGRDGNIIEALTEAQALGLLTLGLTNGPIDYPILDFCFAVDSDDQMVVQEIHETLYHILWELVHIYFEHKGMLI
jgi:D-sedoheptulose 7-phosphate isomerase